MAVRTTHCKQVRPKMKQTNQLTNLFFSPLSLLLSHFRALYQMQRSDKQPPTLPPPRCVCTVAISKSISCHFSFLLTQSYSLHLAQGDKAGSVVWPNKFCTFFGRIFALYDLHLVYRAEGSTTPWNNGSEWRCWVIKVTSATKLQLSQTLVEDRMYPVSRHLHSFNYTFRVQKYLNLHLCVKSHGLYPSCHLDFRNKAHKLFRNILLYRFSALRSRPLMGFPQLQEIFANCY